MLAAGLLVLAGGLALETTQATDSADGRWSTTAIEWASAPAGQGNRLLAGASTVARGSQSSSGVWLTSLHRGTASSWSATLDVAPDAAFRPRLAGSVALGRNIGNGLVLTGGLRLQHWQGADVLGIRPGLEFYPQGQPWWLTASVDQAWSDGVAFPLGGSVRVDWQAEPRVRVFALHARGGEPLGNGSDIRRTGTATGIEFAPQLDRGPSWSLIFASEKRDASPARTLVTVRASFGF